MPFFPSIWVNIFLVFEEKVLKLPSSNSAVSSCSVWPQQIEALFHVARWVSSESHYTINLTIDGKSMYEVTAKACCKSEFPSLPPLRAIALFSLP